MIISYCHKSPVAMSVRSVQSVRSLVALLAVSGTVLSSTDVGKGDLTK